MRLQSGARHPAGPQSISSSHCSTGSHWRLPVGGGWLTTEPSAPGRKAQHQQPTCIFLHPADGSRAAPFLAPCQLTVDVLLLRTPVQRQPFRREGATFLKDSGPGRAPFAPLSSAWGQSHRGFGECFAALRNEAPGQDSCDSLPGTVEKALVLVVHMGENARDLPLICTNDTVLSSFPEAPAFFPEVTGGAESPSDNHAEEAEAMPGRQNPKAGWGGSQLPLLKRQGERSPECSPIQNGKLNSIVWTWVVTNLGFSFPRWAESVPGDPFILRVWMQKEGGRLADSGP